MVFLKGTKETLQRKGWELELNIHVPKLSWTLKKRQSNSILAIMENTCFVRKHSCKNGWKSFRTNPFLQTFLAVCAQKEKIIQDKKMPSIKLVHTIKTQLLIPLPRFKPPHLMLSSGTLQSIFQNLLSLNSLALQVTLEK